jgi:hypothetical protein
MDILNNMKMIFGYDVMTYNGEMPNCLHPKFLNTIHNVSDFDYSMSGEGYKKRWNEDWYLYNSNFWNQFCEKKSIYDIIKYESDKKWFYIVEPFGSFESFFGNHYFYTELALKNISKVALEQIKNGNGNLLINYIIDGGLGVTKSNFQKIIDFTRENNIPDEKVHLIFQDFKLKDNLDKMGVKYNVYDFNLAYQSKSQEFSNTINNPDFSYWGEDSHEPQIGKMQKKCSSIATHAEFTESIGSDKKDFLFLCRHWKLHRIALMSMLHKLGLDNNLVSWDNKFFDENTIRDFQNIDYNPEFVELIKTTSRHLDIEDLTKIAGYGFESKDIYLNSYISLVSESIFFQIDADENGLSDFPTGYLSEKIWKPIGHSQPFILAGPSKSLKYLKTLGFKTFSPYIDESYDLENNDYKRLELIVKEVDKFANKTKEEKDDFLRNVSEICKYNQELFLKYSNENINTEVCKIIVDKLNSSL